MNTWFWATPVLLILSNAAMLAAWYGHLKMNGSTHSWPLWTIIGISWAIALVEYILMVPANRFGYQGFGGPYNLIQLKVMQEVIHLGLFALMVTLFFKGETLTWKHALAGVFLVAAVFLVFSDSK